MPLGARYGYDVMVSVGEALFLRCRNGREIQCELGENNINISLREIDHLGRRFIENEKNHALRAWSEFNGSAS